MARVLITGAAGFIGSHLAERLLARGDEVVGLDNFDPFYDVALKERNVRIIESRAVASGARFRLERGDIRDAAATHRALHAADGAVVDAIVHLAARAGVRPSICEPALYQSVNVEGTVCLLEAARALGIRRFVFASSSSVYGANEKVPFHEEDRVDNPVSPYAATKKAGELLCFTYAHLYAMDIACLRFFTVYGPRQRPEMAIHLFARAILEHRPVAIYGDGTSERDYTYIDDIIDGVVGALDRSCGYRIYNLGESRRVMLRELVSLLEKHLKTRAHLRHEPNQPGDVPITYADISRARAELGYAPKVDIDEGLSRFARWLLAEPNGSRRATSSNGPP
jgi:UDP-glucuronate 4-epimerase